jgi:hypothetical protein
MLISGLLKRPFLIILPPPFEEDAGDGLDLFFRSLGAFNDLEGDFTFVWFLSWHTEDLILLVILVSFENVRPLRGPVHDLLAVGAADGERFVGVGVHSSICHSDIKPSKDPPISFIV